MGLASKHFLWCASCTVQWNGLTCCSKLNGIYYNCVYAHLSGCPGPCPLYRTDWFHCVMASSPFSFSSIPFFAESIRKSNDINNFDWKKTHWCLWPSLRSKMLSIKFRQKYCNICKWLMLWLLLSVDIVWLSHSPICWEMLARKYTWLWSQAPLKMKQYVHNMFEEKKTHQQNNTNRLLLLLNCMISVHSVDRRLAYNSIHLIVFKHENIKTVIYRWALWSHSLLGCVSRLMSQMRQKSGSESSCVCVKDRQKETQCPIRFLFVIFSPSFLSALLL